MVMPYHLHMPSYFLETFTEYPSVGENIFLVSGHIHGQQIGIAVFGSIEVLFYLLFHQNRYFFSIYPNDSF